MSSKDFLRLFVPPIYYTVKHKLLDNPQELPPPLPKRVRKGDRMIVIGNGPSLNKTMELYGDIVRNTECMMVNFSAATPLFEDIKPSVYAMVDPGFIETTIETEKSAIVSLIDHLVQKTTWNLTIIMPYSFKSWWAIDQLNQNHHISLMFFNEVWTNASEPLLFDQYETGLYTPPGQTVLTTCIWLSIYWNYPETYLVGADTSFIKDMYVSQKDNKVYTIDTHYYNNDDVCYLEKDLESNGRSANCTVEMALRNVHTMFVEYEMLNRYAKWKGKKVYNASEFSLIDCFDRKKLYEY